MRRLPLIAALTVSALGAAVPRGQGPPARAALVIVVDGLRPDYVTPDLMPRLARLGGRGVVFSAHHAVVPTVTRVNGASITSGAYPETHGLLGNTIYIPSVNPARGLDTGSYEILESVARAEGRLLTTPTLGEILQRSGRKLLAVSSGSSGSAFVLNDTVANGAVIHHDFTRPRELGARVLDALGPPPPPATPNDARNRRAIDAYLKLGLDDLRPDVTLLWISDPDTTAHAKGIGSADAREALALVDAGIGRIEDTLQAKGLLGRTNIIVTSDHGFSTYTGALDLPALVRPFVRTMGDGSPDVVVAEGAIHLRVRDADRVTAIAAALQARPEVGAVFTRPRARGAHEGVVLGTLSFEVARWGHARSGDILVSPNWTREANEAGYEGKTTSRGVAGHGSSSPYDIHNTLIAVGPDFRERARSSVPTGNVDLAPTLLRLLGLPVPATMTGRVIEEALRDGPPIASVPVEHVTETVRTPDGSYELSAHISMAAGHRYLDDTEVKRRR